LDLSQHRTATARDREFTTLRGLPEGFFLALLSASYLGIRTPAGRPRKIVIFNVLQQTMNIGRGQRLISYRSARFGSDVKRCDVTNRYDMSYRRGVKSLLSGKRGIDVFGTILRS
jgi:hypothetical protein